MNRNTECLALADCVSNPGDRALLVAMAARWHDLAERAEAGDKSLGEGLDVAPRHGAEKNELEQLIFAQGIGAALAEPVAQSLPVAEVMRLSGGGRFPFRHAPFNPAPL